MNRITVAMADDHKVVTRSLKAYLESFPDIEVAGMAASGEELLEKLAFWRPHVVVVDLLIPGGIDGIETTRRIREQAPAVRVVALTASLDEPRMMGVLRAGASGYVRKGSEPEVLLAAVRAVAAGKTYIDPSVGARFLHNPGEEITPREMDVLRQVALGRSNKEIGAALHVSEETVKSHVGNLLAKLQVENRAQAIVQALKRGLVSLEELH